jgi:hypothetical protein
MELTIVENVLLDEDLIQDCIINGAGKLVVRDNIITSDTSKEQETNKKSKYTIRGFGTILRKRSPKSGLCYVSATRTHRSGTIYMEDLSIPNSAKSTPGSSGASTPNSRKVYMSNTVDKLALEKLRNYLHETEKGGKQEEEESIDHIRDENFYWNGEGKLYPNEKIVTGQKLYYLFTTRVSEKDERKRMNQLDNASTGWMYISNFRMFFVEDITPQVGYFKLLLFLICKGIHSFCASYNNIEDRESRWTIK